MSDRNIVDAPPYAGQPAYSLGEQGLRRVMIWPSLTPAKPSTNIGLHLFPIQQVFNVNSTIPPQEERTMPASWVDINVKPSAMEG